MHASGRRRIKLSGTGSLPQLNDTPREHEWAKAQSLVSVEAVLLLITGEKVGVPIQNFGGAKIEEDGDPARKLFHFQFAINSEKGKRMCQLSR
jgi:hypothetical protein